MAGQTKLFKGELMEEKLRIYFLSNNYYVVRGIDYEYEGNAITDIDLFLYGRTSSLNRERINVDIKNKRVPKAFERILWTKGLQKLLNFDNCVVATTDKRELIRQYGLDHDVIILDGNFLDRLSSKHTTRVSEEDFHLELKNIKSFKSFRNQTWKDLYQKSKARLLNESDFSGFNRSIQTVEYFLKKCFDPQKKEMAIKMTYVTLSHSLIILDYILKDIAFLDQTLRQEKLQDGFLYGNLGAKGVDKTIDLAIKLVDSSKSVNSIKNGLENANTSLLKEYFSKVEVIKNIFRISIELEGYCFENEKVTPNEISVEAKSTITIFLDYFGINRKDFFTLFS